MRLRDEDRAHGHQGLTNDAIERTYRKLAPLYDVLYGPILHPGRVRAIDALGLRPGHRVLELGTGSGLSFALYPHDVSVTAVDISEPMLERARARRDRLGARHVRLARMDAAKLDLAAGEFDAVFTPYLLNNAPDPAGIAREMRRVAKPGSGRIVLLNHFRQRGDRWTQAAGRVMGPLTRSIGVSWNLELEGLLADAGLEVVSTRKVNAGAFSTLAVCRA